MPVRILPRPTASQYSYIPRSFDRSSVSYILRGGGVPSKLARKAE